MFQDITNELPSDIEDAIRNHPLFRKATDETISTLCKSMKARIFFTGDKIIQEGDEGKAVFFLIKGEVDILSSDDEVIYATLYSGSFFGEIALLKDVCRTANVVARSKCFLLSLHKQDYLELVNLDFWKELEEEASIRLEKLENNRRKTVTDEIPSYTINTLAGNSGSANALNEIFDEDMVCEALKKLPIFQFCDHTSLIEITKVMKTISFQPGDISLDENGSSIILIIEGIVTGGNKDENRKGSLIQYEFYGKLRLDPHLGDEKETLLALSSGSACLLESSSVLELMEENNTLKEQVGLAMVRSLDHSLDNLVPSEEKPTVKQQSSLSKSFDSQRLIISSGEKRRASVAVWADPSLMKMAERKKNSNRSKLTESSGGIQGLSPFLEIIADKPNIFKRIVDFLKLRDVYVLSCTSHILSLEISKLTTICVNIDLCEYANSLNNAGISGITSLWKFSIRCLNLKGCFKVNNLGLTFIAANCPNLEILNLHSCWDISSQGLSTLAEGCPKLRSIDLSNCRKVDSVGVIALLDNSQIEEIILSYCKSLNNDLYKDPFLFSNLKRINLQRCTTITDVGYRHLEGHLLEVEYLVLSDCSFLTDASISIICKSCPNLRALSVSFVCGLTEKCVDSLILLTELETLDVSFCGNLMTNMALEQVGKCLALKRLGIRGCFKVGQQFMIDYLDRSTTIECLNVSQCKNLQLDYLKRNYSNIKFLEIENVIDEDPSSKFLTNSRYPIGTRQRTKTI